MYISFISSNSCSISALLTYEHLFQQHCRYLIFQSRYSESASGLPLGEDNTATSWTDITTGTGSGDLPVHCHICECPPISLNGQSGRGGTCLQPWLIWNEIDIRIPQQHCIHVAENNDHVLYAYVMLCSTDRQTDLVRWMNTEN